MPIDILMPQLGMEMTEGVVARWLVPDGAGVVRGQALLEIETDKVTHTIEASADGVLQQMSEERATVSIGTPVGYLLRQSEDRVNVASGRAAAGSALPLASIPSAGVPKRPTGEVTASPVARRLAAQLGLDLTTIRGTGPGGRIVEADVQAAAQAQKTPAPSQRVVLRRIALSGRRKVIADRMVASLSRTAQLTITREVDAGVLVSVRRALVERADELGVRVTYDALLAKVLAQSLVECPELNSVVEGEEILLLGEVHVAVAIAHADGLIVPVVRNVESRPLVEVARAVEDLAQRAAKGSLRLEDLEGGTVTVTNLGMYGVDAFTPILNPPQSAILGIGRIIDRPVVVKTEVVVRPVMQLSLSWDHRVADGATAATLLGRIADLVGHEEYLVSLA